MNVRLRQWCSLPQSTGETEIGPIVEHRRGGLSVRYDAETERDVVWTRLEFRQVFGVRFTAEACVEGWMIDAFSRVCVADHSSWVHELAARATEGRGVIEKAQHFLIYFDDFGCYEVAAARLEVIVEDAAGGGEQEQP